MSKKKERRIYIEEAAELLNRRVGTIRKWESTGALPKELLPQREGARQWRWWTPEQIKGIKAWLKKTDRRPGKGLPHYKPKQKDVEKVIEKLRGPRKRADEDQEEEDDSIEARLERAKAKASE